MNDSYEYPIENIPAIVQDFRRHIGRRAKTVGDQLVFGYCPYCDGGDNHDKDTFAISTVTGQFECKRSSCGARGNLITLARDFADRGFSLGRELNTYYNIDGSAARFKRFKDAHRPIEVRPRAIDYLLSRGIPEEVTKKYEITTMPERDNVLVFPFRDETGELVFVKYRDTEYVKGGPGNKEWCVAGNYKKILFGMNHCEDFGTLVITEGQIDSLSLAAASIKNAVSVPTGKNGFTWKPVVWNWLVKFEEIVVFGDREGGEITLAKEISQFFPKKVRIVKVEDYHGCKDANEILQKCGPGALVAAVKNAEARVSLRIRNLADVDMVDLDTMTYYPTGIKSLDDAIGHGFHEGELNILTGKAGEGKSTFASQIVAKMIKNGVKCFCYSGELPDYMFRAWLDKQVIGNGVYTEAARNAAAAWYDGKCFLYDNSSVIDEHETIKDLIAQAVRDLGCKFVLIDNLMTAMEDKPTEDLFRQQSNFVKELSRYAKGFNITILLVAHPRKNSGDDNDSISGSGDITNRANIVMRFERARDNKGKLRTDNVSLIKITKNRTTGQLNDQGFPVIYEPESMRIHEANAKPEEFMASEYIPFEPSEEDEIPF